VTTFTPITPTDIPHNTHTISPGNPVVVTSAALYRLSWYGLVEDTAPDFADLVATFDQQYRPADTFGVAGLESQEHALMWFGPAEIIRRFAASMAAGPAVPPFAEFNSTGVHAVGWPPDHAWSRAIPRGTWTPQGHGILAEYDFPDYGQIVVYEQPGTPTYGSVRATGTAHQWELADDSEGLVPTVTWHCTRCHLESAHDRRVYTSADPGDRGAACRDARRHLRSGRCPGQDGDGGRWGTRKWDEVTATIESVASGVAAPTTVEGLHASRCATSKVDPHNVLSSSSCAEVRAARVATATAATV
jgi:hypothetical protein